MMNVLNIVLGVILQNYDDIMTEPQNRKCEISCIFQYSY